MKNRYTEIELKFSLFNTKELIKKLNKITKPKQKNIFQKDTYYVPAHRNFLAKKKLNEWLRIRETKYKATLNYKNWYPGGFHCKEFETVVEDVNALKKILKILDFKEIVTVEKIRNAWMYKGVEIAVDKVNGLGSFIELETKININVIEAKKLVHKILKELKVKIGAQDFLGYPCRLLEKRNL